MKEYNSSLYPFESKWTQIEGNQIHYIDEGQGDVILFSHPPLASSFMYRDFVKFLRKQYRCIALDYPGFGLSAASDHYPMDIEAQSKIVEKFILKLDLNNIYVLGHDTGGPSVFGAAIHHPQLFKGVILTDTIIYPISQYAKLGKMLGIVGATSFTWFNAYTNFLVRTTFKYGIRTTRLTKEVRQEYHRMFNTREKRKHITQMLCSLKESELFMHQIKRGFETVLNNKPALLIYGEKDPVTALGIPDRIHQLLPNSELFLIPKEGHFPHEGQPKQMSEIMHHWIKKNTLTGNI